jgi:hypothetical protein
MVNFEVTFATLGDGQLLRPKFPSLKVESFEMAAFWNNAPFSLLDAGRSERRGLAQPSGQADDVGSKNL